MAAPNRPQFFCTRPDGSLTPLLAVDELPPGLAVHGAPRVLNPGETQGMTSCGLAAPRTEPWPIEGVAHVFPPDVGKDGLVEIQKLLVQIMSDLQVPSHIRMTVQGILYRAIDLPGTMHIDSASNGTVMSPLAPVFSMNAHVGKGVPHSKKEYCSYWIRHGECDYSQQGCLYKHEMPTDPAMLEKLGLRDIPRWYRELHNVPSFLTQGPGRGQLSIADHPATRTHSNASTEVNENGNTGLIKTPPRGPASHGTNSGFNNHRNSNRNSGSNGQFGNHNWKTVRAGRNRNMNGSPRSKSSVGERSADPSPGRVTNLSFGQFGGFVANDNNQNVTAPANVQFVTAGPALTRGPVTPVTPVTPIVPVVPVVPNMSILDDANARNRTLASQVNELTRIDEDVFEGASTKPVAPQTCSSNPRNIYAHSSNPSTDGGVMLPKEATPFSEPTSIADLVAQENFPLTAMDTRVTWGPVGGPIMMSASATGPSPSAGQRASVYGFYPLRSPAH